MSTCEFCDAIMVPGERNCPGCGAAASTWSEAEEKLPEVVQSLPLENMVLRRIGGKSGDIEITNPTSEDIAQVIGGLVAANFATDSFFAILSDEDDRSGQTYLQVMYEESTDGYTVEYRDGAEDKHYRDNTSVVSSHQLVKLFIAYAKCDIGWLDEMKFQRVDFP